jgi:hypothetical protein
MQDKNADSLLAELDALLNQSRDCLVAGVCEATDELSLTMAADFVTGVLAAARRAGGDGSDYVKQIETIIDDVGWSRIRYAVPAVRGILNALRRAVALGYLVTMRDLARAEVFSDFLDMAQYLLEEGYKDAAAVLVRGVLEAHLRELCASKGIDTTHTDTRGKTVSKKVDTMNAELKKAGVYSTTDQKSVTSWYGLGTDAAHGNYDGYTTEQVKLTLQGVRDFLGRHAT